ncbi:hypothetical protein EHS25_008180 [Saitozyma podzolica]|uniref:Uncharacterized protein n=1 Tax=Saitozyma podzolica TaxID=1890683 RepID=A0A427YNP4_9TREE|nr:hypothetical protein EHS25_008180 [Saitozyma podzolica]
MTDASAFLRKRKDKRRVASRPVGVGFSAAALAGSSSSASPAASSPQPQPIPPSALAAPAGPSGLKIEPGRDADAEAKARASGQIVEIKLVSSGLGLGADTRFNYPSSDTTQSEATGASSPPTFALDEEGNIIGRYLYDEKGQPVLGPDGRQVVETKERADASLIGGDGPKRRGKKGVKEVFHQDKDVMRLRREEAVPWILESGRPSTSISSSSSSPAPANGEASEGSANHVPEHWVGRLVEASTLPTVLLVNDGTDAGFKVVPMGRTYRFEPERPFKVLDPDAAHKLYEHQTKYKIHDRWAHREGGPDISSPANVSVMPNGLAVPGQPDVKPKIEREGEAQMRQEDRAARMEARMRAMRAAANGRVAGPKVKVERFDDDERKEGRQLTRGMEGGLDEELDYDFNEEFQDDEDVNTFYRDAEEEEEAKLQEERMKKEYKLANANVGDRPQIEEDMSDEEGLFGDHSLTADGKRLRRMMRKRMGSEDLFGDSDDDSDSSEDTVRSEKPKESKDAQADGERSAPGSAERPSRPPSRGPNAARTSSPSGRPRQPPTPGKASTAPPGSGHSLAAQRAFSRGASPRRSRGNSPLGRGTSPETRASPGPSGREASPVPGQSQSQGQGQGRGMSPPAGRAGSPVIRREASPAPGVPGGGIPSPTGSASGSGSRSKQLKRTESPTPGPGAGSAGGTPSSKRKSEPGDNNARPKDPPRKKKKSSNTPTPGPEEIPSFPGMISRDEILAWFRKQPALVPMPNAISAFRQRILDAKERQGDNQNLFLGWVSRLTSTEPGKMLKLKDEFR